MRDRLLASWRQRLCWRWSWVCGGMKLCHNHHLCQYIGNNQPQYMDISILSSSQSSCSQFSGVRHLRRRLWQLLPSRNHLHGLGNQREEQNDLPDYWHHNHGFQLNQRNKRCTQVSKKYYLILWCIENHRDWLFFSCPPLSLLLGCSTSSPKPETEFSKESENIMFN